MSCNDLEVPQPAAAGLATGGADQPAPLDSIAEKYLILARCYCEGYAIWWRPNGAGYTNNLDWAGHYTRWEAENIVRESDRGEEMWPLSLIEAQTKPRRMIDFGDSASECMREKRNRDWLKERS